jgi:hypothetical protein
MFPASSYHPWRGFKHAIVRLGCFIMLFCAVVVIVAIIAAKMPID